jgi:hypothetical protein
MFAYGYGATVILNGLADRGEPQASTSRVTGMHVCTGKTTTYELTLEPWGPYSEPNKANVPRSFYRTVRTGDLICPVLHSGALGIRWFSVQHCRH